MRRSRRLHQHVGFGRILRPVFPPGRRMLAFQAMFSAVADALRARHGIVLTDRLMPGSGITVSYTQQVVTIRLGRPDEVLGALDGHTRALGYVRDQRPYVDPVNVVPRHWYRYEKVRALPDLSFALASPGELKGFVVPEGSVGVTLNITTGLTESEDGRRSSKTPNSATRAHLAQRGVDITPPLPRQRFMWWGARVLMQVRLTWAMRRLCPHRGRLVATWLVGGEFIGPYTLGVMTIRSGTRQQVVDELHERANKKGYRYGADATAASPRTRVMNLTVYGPDEQIDADGRRVPEGSIAVIVTLMAA